MDDIVRVHLKGFRAIKDADIKLNGITLVSGINGCGKSTISKLLYRAIDIALRYDEIAKKEIYTDPLGWLFDAVDTVHREISRLYARSGLGNNTQAEYIHSKSEKDLSDLNLDEWRELLNTIEVKYLSLKSNGNSDSDPYLGRVIRVLINALAEDPFAEEAYSMDLDLLDYLPKVYNKIKDAYEDVLLVVERRPASIWREAIFDAFDEYYPEINEVQFQIYEYGAQISEVYSVHKPVSVATVVYCDTPAPIGDWHFSGFMGSQDAWEHLAKLLSNPSRELKSKEKDLLSHLSDDVLNGQANSKEELLGKRLIFERDDRSFWLSEVATGIKAFSVIQLLLKNGHLDDRTLLIIDEPEAHLHPQWVVEYAHMVVLLNKHLGVKFFLASHNPDFVSALKYIAEKEGIGEKTNFYLAEEDENEPKQFNYRSLGLNIEPIFSSFNLAFNRLDKALKTENNHGATE